MWLSTRSGHRSEDSPRAALPNLDLEQTRRDFEAMTGVRRNRSVTGMNGHSLKTEFPSPHQNRLDQLAAQAAVTLLGHDVRASTSPSDVIHGVILAQNHQH